MQHWWSNVSREERAIPVLHILHATDATDSAWTTLGRNRCLCDEKATTNGRLWRGVSCCLMRHFVSVIMVGSCVECPTP